MSEICNNRSLKLSNGNLLCPNCGERLTPADLEVYAKCPYCDWSFPRDARLDDFVISPIVNRWMARANSQFPRD